jgi:group I intron endonuclease
MIKDIITFNSKDDVYKCGVYKLFHEKCSEGFYIGSAGSRNYRKGKIGFARRFDIHKSRLKLGNHHSKRLQLICNKFGVEGLKMQIIEICDHSIRKEREQYYLNILNPLFNSATSAFDLTGYKHQEDALLKMSLAKTGVKLTTTARNKISAALKGKTPKNFKTLQSPESRMKRSKSLKGRKLSEKNLLSIRTPVRQYTKEGLFIREYKSIREASINSKTDPTSISRASSGKWKSAGGFVWESIKNGYSLKRLNINHE